MRALITSRSFMVNAIVASITALIIAVWAVQSWSNFTALGADIAGATRTSQTEISQQWQTAQATKDAEIKSAQSAQLLTAVAEELSAQLTEGTAVLAPEITSPTSPDATTFPSSGAKVASPEPSVIVKTCTKAGGLYVTRGTAPTTYGVCIFNDGTECNAQHFAAQKCHIGQYARAEEGMK